jgi:hypothetical protein
MGLSAPRVVYGIHSATFYDPKTDLPFGESRVLGNGTFTMQGETIELRGGSNRFPWSIQDGNINATIELALKEYPNFLMELFLGKKPTAVVADATGAVDNFINKFGVSVKNAVNGISAIAPLAGSEANLKFTKYVVKAVSANTVNIYAMSNIDFNRGTDVDFQDDLLKINSAPITIAIGSNPVANFGLDLTGIGTPAFVIGDTASFEVLPVHAGAMDVVVGGLSDVFPEFGVVLMTQQLGSGEMFEIDVFKCKAIGLNLGAQEKAFSETPVSAKAFYDASKGGICKIRAVTP